MQIIALGTLPFTKMNRPTPCFLTAYLSERQNKDRLYRRVNKGNESESLRGIKKVAVSKIEFTRLKF